MSRKFFLPSLALSALLVSSASAGIEFGLLSDFESGTNEGWAGGAAPTNIATGGPAGVDDNFLSFGNGGNLATFNTGLSGELSSVVTRIEVDVQRPLGEPDVELRLVLFGPGTGNRWTSSTSTIIEGNGEWATYSFSVLEDDLTQVLGTGSYADLIGNVNRIMFRHDPGAASANGAAIAGTLGIDNVFAAPEPASCLLLAALSAVAGGFRSRR